MRKCIFMMLCLLILNGCTSTDKSVYETKGLTQIVYKDIDSVCEQDELIVEGEQLLKAMQNELYLSFIVDSSIEITPDEFEGYDHLIITNSKWVERYAEMDELLAVDFESIPIGMQNFLSVQMPLWTRDNSVLPEGINLYEYAGDRFLGLPFGVGTMSAAIEAENPLILMVDDPVSTLSAKSILLPLTSSSNLIFMNEEKLQSILQDSFIEPYILEISPVNFTLMK